MGKNGAVLAVLAMHLMTETVAEIMNVAFIESYAQGNCSGTPMYSMYLQADVCQESTRVGDVQLYKKSVCSDTGFSSASYTDAACTPATKRSVLFAYNFSACVFDHHELVKASPCQIMNCTEDRPGRITTCIEVATTPAPTPAPTSNGQANYVSGSNTRWLLAGAIMTVILASNQARD